MLGVVGTLGFELVPEEGIDLGRRPTGLGELIKPCAGVESAQEFAVGRGFRSKGKFGVAGLEVDQLRDG